MAYAYPPAGGYPPQGPTYPPAQPGIYPPAQYPPAQPGGYPPQQPGGYPPQGYPPQAGGGVPPYGSVSGARGFNPGGTFRATMAHQRNTAGPTAGPMCSKVVLRVACRDLIKLDTFSESDPMCIVYGISGGGWYEIGRTERIKNQKNPDFLKSFSLDYFFEQKQMLRFDVYDSDKSTSDQAHANLDVHDFIGSVETSLGAIVGAASGNFTRPLTTGQLGLAKKSTKARGIIHITAEEDASASVSGVCIMQFRASSCDKKDFFGKSDPYLEIWRMSANGREVLVHKTETVMKTLNPTWRAFELPMAKLTGGGDPTLPLRFKVYDWDSDGGHDFIGGCSTTLMEMGGAGAGGSPEWDLVNPKKMPGGKKAKRGYTNSGVLHLMSFHIEEVPSFLEFLHGGLELDFTVAVDFTGSNGNPELPTSLHYLNPHQPNQYASAIYSVGNIISDYDNDQMFPVFGYGGKVSGAVSHCFPLNANPGSPAVHGIPGVVGVYEQAIRTVQLWGPTNFSPVIEQTVAMAAAARMGKDYYVLLIITDGVITDQAQTINSIVKASRLPISIIIVGVGNADFGDMEMLDGDDHALTSAQTGEKAARDIVQFVPYRKFHNDGALLAKEVLAELPDQVVQYYKQRKFKPVKPA